MSNSNSFDLFPCSACGKCCQRVGKSIQTKFLDRGDLTCLYFDEKTKLCTIYEKLPSVCRVEDYYRTHLSHIYTWDEFVKINLVICNNF